jgi:hypothetical protein
MHINDFELSKFVSLYERQRMENVTLLTAALGNQLCDIFLVVKEFIKVRDYILTARLSIETSIE